MNGLKHGTYEHAVQSMQHTVRHATEPGCLASPAESSNLLGSQCVSESVSQAVTGTLASPAVIPFALQSVSQSAGWLVRQSGIMRLAPFAGFLFTQQASRKRGRSDARRQP